MTGQKENARLLRDEASRLRERLRETRERLRIVNAEIAALAQSGNRAKAKTQRARSRTRGSKLEGTEGDRS